MFGAMAIPTEYNTVAYSGPQENIINVLSDMMDMEIFFDMAPSALIIVAPQNL